MLTIDNVNLIIMFFVNLGCQKLKNVTDENIEVGAEKNLNWDSVYLLKCAFDDKYFIGIENNFVKIGLKEENPFLWKL